LGHSCIIRMFLQNKNPPERIFAKLCDACFALSDVHMLYLSQKRSNRSKS